ncbi:MAG: thiolase family protein [Ilumatobacteraceae bacterium]
MTGLRGEAAIVGYAQWQPIRKPLGPHRFTVEQWAELARLALDDAGLPADAVDGIVTSKIAEASIFAPATVSEYLGLPVRFAEYVDLGGATAAAMVWRAAAAIELGVCDVVVCALPARPTPEPPYERPGDPTHLGSFSAAWGSPQAEFDVPYGNVYQNASYAMIAQRYAAEYGYDPRSMAKIAVDQRTNACANPDAIFFGKPISAEDVLNSPLIADPLHRLEIVMSAFGGAAVVVARAGLDRTADHREVKVTGFGERLEFKTPTYAPDMLKTPMFDASRSAFAMAGHNPADMDMVSVYDCYTITVLTTLEDAGFCGRGEGTQFVDAHDLTFAGDFPCNTHGGQLSFGQAGIAGGMSHVIDAASQIQGRSGARQVRDCNRAFVTGNGGVMGEQVALVLEGT